MNEETQPLARVLTGVPGLDAILEGGLMKGGVYLAVGSPGSGKTILGNQVCFNHAAKGGRSPYLTVLAESHGRMLSSIGQLGFFDETAARERSRLRKRLPVTRDRRPARPARSDPQVGSETARDPAGDRRPHHGDGRC